MNDICGIDFALSGLGLVIYRCSVGQRPTLLIMPLWGNSQVQNYDKKSV